jgi:hypothetical protein
VREGELLLLQPITGFLEPKVRSACIALMPSLSRPVQRGMHVQSHLLKHSHSMDDLLKRASCSVGSGVQSTYRTTRRSTWSERNRDIRYRKWERLRGCGR